MATAEVEEVDARAAGDSSLNTDHSSIPEAAAAIVQNEDTPHMSDSSIFDLNQDCILNILGYLPMKDLLSFEQVCPYWKSVAELSWRRFTEFDCTTTTHNYLDKNFKESLIRCGPSMKKIHFPPLTHAANTCQLLKIVVNHCPNIECVVLNETHFKKPYAKDFTKILNHIKCLEIESNRFELNYYVIKQLFKRVSKLQTLTFNGFNTKNPDIIEKAFQFLPKSLIAINFGELYYPSDNFFIQLRKFCPNLEVLSLSAEVYENDDFDIAKFSKLREFELRYSEINIEYMEHILDLKFLEKLVLTCTAEMDDEFLGRIASSLPLLRHLEVSAALERNVTDKGIEKLAQLQHLEHLDLSYYELFSGKGLGAVAANGKLKELILINTMVENSVISTVLSQCLHLKFLDLSACSEITEEAVTTLLEIFTPENKRTKLTVVLGGSDYVKCKILEESVGETDEEGGGGDSVGYIPKDIFATNLSILCVTNNIKAKILSRYGDYFSDDDLYDEEDDDDFYDDYDDDDDLGWYDNSSDSEYQLVDYDIMLGHIPHWED